MECPIYISSVILRSNCEWLFVTCSSLTDQTLSNTLAARKFSNGICPVVKVKVKVKSESRTEISFVLFPLLLDLKWLHDGANFILELGCSDCLRLWCSSKTWMKLEHWKSLKIESSNAIIYILDFLQRLSIKTFLRIEYWSDGRWNKYTSL